jgi:hypothetical protein
VGRGLLESFDAKEMLAYQHSGFSVDVGVCIEAHDPCALERLLRYCARPPFACARLRKEGCNLVYRCAKQHSEPSSDKRGAKVDELTLTPLELIERIAALEPPPRTHRHRYYGVLAPNSPLRSAVTALAAHAVPAITGEGLPGLVPADKAAPPAPAPAPAKPKRASLRSSRTVLISTASWNTSGRSQNPRALPRHAGRRCGRTVMRKLERAPKLSQIGTWPRNRHPTTRRTSASIGEGSKQRFTCAAG